MTTKEKILTATLELATQNGLGNVSLSQIAKQVGIQKPSLYNHFSSKDEIIKGLYEYLRRQARNKVSQGMIDYENLVKGKRAYEILNQTVHSYISMNQDPHMTQFYKFIMSERSIQKEAASIMVAETEKMIQATKQLFSEMQLQHVMEFKNVDIAAVSFAMAVHAMMDYIGDQKMAETEATAVKLLDDYIKEFCECYKAQG